MVGIGARLRKAREEKGYSLDQVAEETKIRVRYLQALEEEAFDQLPGQVYARGFLQTYARFIEVPLSEIPPVVVPDKVRSVTFSSGLKERAYIRHVYGRIFKAAIVCGITGFLLINGYNLLVKIGEVGEQPVVPSQTGNLSETPSPNTPGTPQLEPASGPVQFTGVIIELRATSDRSWLSVSIDGRQDFRGFITKDETLTFKGERKIKITLGNAGVVEVWENGIPIGVLGKVGDVVTREFSANQVN